MFYEDGSEGFSKEHQINQSLQTGRLITFFSFFLLWSLSGLFPQGGSKAEQLVVRGCSGCKSAVEKLAGRVLKDSSLCPWHLCCHSLPKQWHNSPSLYPQFWVTAYSLFPQGRSQAGDRVSRFKSTYKMGTLDTLLNCEFPFPHLYNRWNVRWEKRVQGYWHFLQINRLLSLPLLTQDCP